MWSIKNMWPFKKTAPSPPPPPHLPVIMKREEFAEAQEAYVARWDKFVKPSQVVMVEAAKAVADYGKLAINYLVVGNAGGLGALIVLAPLMHDSAPNWIAKQFWTAAAFACGAALAVITAMIGHFNYASHATSYDMQAKRDDVWLKAPAFGFDENWRRLTDEWMGRAQLKANRRANITNFLSVVFLLLSAFCWIFGAVKLAMSVSGVSYP